MLFNLGLSNKYYYILRYYVEITKKCKTYEELKKVIKDEYADLRVYMCLAAYLNHDIDYSKGTANDFINNFGDKLIF